MSPSAPNPLASALSRYGWQPRWHRMGIVHAMPVMRIAACNICGGRIARGGASAPPPCYLPDISASADKPQETTEAK